MKASKGLTLLETMMALAVGALVLIGGIIFYKSNQQTAAVTKIVNDMNAIVSAYKAYVAQGNVLVLPGNNGIPMTTLQKLGFLPDPLNDPWGQTYESNSCNPQGNTQVAIVIQSLQAGDATCNAVKSAVKGSADSVGLSNCMQTTSTSCGFVYDF